MSSNVKNRISLECDFCGKTFERVMSHHLMNIKRGTAGCFCSRDCSYNGRQTHGRFRHEKHGCRCDICVAAVAVHNKRRQTDRYILIASIKLESGCVDCGYAEYACGLQFDHLDGSTKEFTIGSGSNGVGIEKLMEEIDKCEIVCGICHAIRTQKRRGGLLLTKKDVGL